MGLLPHVEFRFGRLPVASHLLRICDLYLSPRGCRQPFEIERLRMGAPTANFLTRRIPVPVAQFLNT